MNIDISIEKSFLIDPQTTNNVIYRHSLILTSNCRGVFRTQPKICDETFFAKIVKV